MCLLSCFCGLIGLLCLGSFVFSCSIISGFSIMSFSICSFPRWPRYSTRSRCVLTVILFSFTIICQKKVLNLKISSGNCFLQQHSCTLGWDYQPNSYSPKISHCSLLNNCTMHVLSIWYSRISQCIIHKIKENWQFIT